MKNHFAEHGAEKMIYDARMQPQAVAHEGVIYIVYQANRDDFVAHPHILAYDIDKKEWTEPVRLGENDKVDHHLAPIIWIEDSGRIHVLHGCHTGKSFKASGADDHVSTVSNFDSGDLNNDTLMIHI